MSKKNGNILDQPIQIGNKSIAESNVQEKYGLIQIKKYDLNNMLKLIGRRAQPLKFPEYTVGLNKTRLIMFKKKGTDCVSCGIKGSYFSLDKPYYNPQNIPPQINLWAIDVDGKHILMTRDHIVPESKGGWNGTFNLQPMCSICNGAKGDKLKKIDYIKHSVLKYKFLLIDKFAKSAKKFLKVFKNKAYKVFDKLEDYNA